MILANYHTHTNFCDGKNTPEEVVQAALEKGFDVLGFSGHGHTPFDLSYCIKDVPGYMQTIRQLKEKYADRLQIYLGVEEDALWPVDNRAEHDYIIGSSHYSVVGGRRYPIDSNPKLFEECINAWNGDVLAFAENYYSFFCDYILKRKPDIIGHFDLITKFDELGESRFLKNPAYCRLAEAAVRKALKSGCIFEVNTGAISRGYRTLPYPQENLLQIIKDEGGRVTVTSDSHQADTLDCAFEETRALLKEVGFKEIYVLYNGQWMADNL